MNLIVRPTRFQVFLIVSAALIAIGVVSSGLLVGWFFQNHILAREQVQTADMVVSQAQQHLVPAAFQQPATPAHAAMFRTFLEGLPGVFRVKAYALNGVIVWSNEPRLIGQAFSTNREFIAATRGEVRTLIGKPAHAAEHAYEDEDAEVAEIYVPIRFTGSAGVTGVIESYRDLRPVFAGVHRTQGRIWLVTSGIGFLLYVSVAFVAWRAAASEARARRDLEEQNRDLALLQRFTRSVVRPLDLGQVARNVVESAGIELRLAEAALYRTNGEGGPSLLALWPVGGTPPDLAPELCAEALETRGHAVRGNQIALPLSTHRGMNHLFVARFKRPIADLGGGAVRTLEIMLDEAAIALTNVELFTEIREAHERLAAILTGITDRIMIMDDRMRIVWMNATGTETFGPDAVGKTCYEVFRGQTEECDGCPALRSLNSGRVERGMQTHPQADGRSRFLDLITAPLRDASGRVHQVLEVARDITELVEMEEQLKKSNQALLDAQAQLVEKERLAAVGQVIVTLHHAILNPLTGILGALQVLKQEVTASPDTVRALAEAEAEIKKVEQLVRRLPDLKRAEGTHYVGDTTMLDVRESSADGEASPPR